jgi:hypothetical protein
LVVVDATGGVAPRAAVAADIVQATGPVMAFDLARAESRTGVDLDDAQAEPIVGRPAIIAQVIHILP